MAEMGSETRNEETPRVLRFRNRPVEELTREELLVAVYRIQDALERERGFRETVRLTQAAFR